MKRIYWYMIATLFLTVGLWWLQAKHDKKKTTTFPLRSTVMQEASATTAQVPDASVPGKRSAAKRKAQRIDLEVPGYSPDEGVVPERHEKDLTGPKIIMSGGESNATQWDDTNDYPSPSDRSGKDNAEVEHSEKIHPLLLSPSPRIGDGHSISSYPRYDDEGRILVGIEYRVDDESGQDVKAIVRAQGGRIYAHIPNSGYIEAYLPTENISKWSDFDWLIRVTPVKPAVLRQGSVVTEGDDLLGAKGIRSLNGTDGSGISVGVISDGVDHLSQAQNSGDLPSSVTVLGNGSGGDEGVAILEIIHDLAPGANLFFHDGGSPARFSQAVAALRDAGCRIIVDDIGFPASQPIFEDGSVALSVSAAVDQDIVFVTAAGNEAKRHMESKWKSTHRQNDTANLYGWFLGTPALVFANDQEGAGIHMDGYGSGFIVLQWSERFGHSGHDYDVAVYDYDGFTNFMHAVSLWHDWQTTGHDEWSSSGTWHDSKGIEHSTAPSQPRKPAEITYSRAVQNGDDDPMELVFLRNTSSRDTKYALVIEGYSDMSSDDTLEVIGEGDLRFDSDIATPDGSIYGHPALARAITVGAVSAFDPGLDDIEDFSSHGPCFVPFSPNPLRPKPDVVSLDGVSVSGAGGFSRIFWGTSAAAPHIAGIAALLMSYDTSLSGEEVSWLIKDNAVDIEEKGFDVESGYGRADASRSLNTLVRQQSIVKGDLVTRDLWIRAVIQTEEKGAVDAVWKKGGEDTTARGDRVIWGHFYADPGDVSWGSRDNPELFVKIWFDVSGRVDVNFIHVSVPDIEVYSDYPYDGIADEGGTTSMTRRYIRHYYKNGASNSSEQEENGTPPAGYSPAGNPTGYGTINDLRIGAVINTQERGPIEALWHQGGQDTTARGDQVVWGHFYADPNDVSWGSRNNPELFVKIWFDRSGRTDVNFFHVSVPDIEVYSALPDTGTYNQKGTTIMANRYVRQEY